MKARSLGRFVAEFLEGFLDTESEATAPGPTVIPVEAIQATVKAAVHEILDPLLDEAAPYEEAPSAEQLDLGFADIERVPGDPVAEMALQRIAEANARAAAREEAQGREPERPVSYDPDDPRSRAPWMSPT